jgi:predicted negative regulator of RcsB-dependent stress response
VELYDTEEQQVEAIKSWWQENGKAVIIGTIVGLCVIGGWKYREATIKEAQESASISYETAIGQLSEKGLESQPTIQQFINSHKESSYASLAALQLSKALIEDNQLDEALAQLNWVKSNTEDAALKVVASYRVARLEAGQTNYQGALDELASITNEGWQGRVLELKGDILLAQGDKDAAYIAYTEAQQANDASQLLKLKLDDLAK